MTASGRTDREPAARSSGTGLPGTGRRCRARRAIGLIGAALLLVVPLMTVAAPASAQTEEPWRAAVTGLTVSGGDQAGELEITWDVHPEGARDYRVKWALAGERFKNYRDRDWNAFPTGTSYTVAGLTPGETYEVAVRARFADKKRSGWSQVTGTARAASTTVVLSTDTSSVSEDAGETTVTVTATLDEAPRATDTVVTVVVGASGDAATEGTDYATVNDVTLTIPAGRTSSTARFALTPTDDDVDEADETLSIIGSTTATDLTVTGTTVTITDDDESGAVVLESFALDSADGLTRGVWSDGTIIWVAYSKDSTVYAYDLATGTRDSSRDIGDLSAEGVNVPRGIWSDGTIMWVADGHEKLYGFNLATGARDESKFVVLAEDSGNNNIRGIWSDGTTVWVADGDDAKIYAYTLASGATDTSKAIDALGAAGNDHPRGIWSDGTTMWVADTRDGKIYAYDLASGTHDSSKDITTLRAAGNRHPWGIWSDGTTMWVGDTSDNRFYSHDLPAGD